jgi:hypothetical protein
MKLIEALKGIQELQRKQEDLQEKVRTHSAYLSVETPVYPNQKRQVAEWVQAQSDILKEILRLRAAIQRTNLVTEVTVNLGGKDVTKTIAEWIHRRRDLASEEAKMWKGLTDKSLKEGYFGESQTKVEIIRCYDPEERDNKIALLESEPTLIDARLEIANAVTDLIEEP